jgi:hypothetical protein
MSIRSCSSRKSHPPDIEGLIALDFLTHLSSANSDIYKILSQKIKFTENSSICRKHNIFGWFDYTKSIISICTDRIKTREEYIYYLNETFYHESVHAAQYCYGKGSQRLKAFNINPSLMKLNAGRTKDLSTAIRISGQQRQIEHEAFWMEDKPNKVKYVVEKYCL